MQGFEPGDDLARAVADGEGSLEDVLHVYEAPPRLLQLGVGQTEVAGPVVGQAPLGLHDEKLDRGPQQPRVVVIGVEGQHDPVGADDGEDLLAGNELTDPAGKTIEEVRPIIDQIDERVRRLLSELLGEAVA